MFQILSSDDRPNFRVVHSLDEALQVIGVPSATFIPVGLFTRIAPAYRDAA
jgi:hypothetical protein